MRVLQRNIWGNVCADQGHKIADDIEIFLMSSVRIFSPFELLVIPEISSLSFKKYMV